MTPLYIIALFSLLVLTLGSPLPGPEPIRPVFGKPCFGGINTGCGLRGGKREAFPEIEVMEEKREALPAPARPVTGKPCFGFDCRLRGGKREVTPKSEAPEEKRDAGPEPAPEPAPEPVRPVTGRPCFGFDCRLRGGK